MQAIKDGQHISIILESDFEADIMFACLNWGVSSMHKSNLITCDGSQADNKKVNVETDMWEVFKTVHP